MNTTILNEMREAVKNETAQILTLDKAKELKGKKIRTIYFGYRGQNGVDEFIVGEIISSLDYERTQKLNDGKFSNRAEYWESYMSFENLDAEKTTLKLISEDGRDTYISAHCKYSNHFNEPTFTCSDADREVYFIEVSHE